MKDNWISLKEYEQIVLEELKEKPVIKMLLEQGIPFEKWTPNIHQMVDDAMGAIRETRILIKED